MEYNFRQIEGKWQQQWKQTGAYTVTNQMDKPKYYVLDMFPYPSGAGLHVGHPLGYIASDIYSRYKRLKGFNVLHPMGFDSFGLPAEQYALDTGQHPAVTTKKNIETFKAQLDNIGFCYDWQREVQTSDPQYYKWTQWIFLQLFNSYYNSEKQKAESIDALIKQFETSGTSGSSSPHSAFSFTAAEWKAFDESKQQDILMNYRLAFIKFGEVNWCEALGTVLANDEVVNGVSERGGHPVEKKKMRQWYLRITAYADRLLQGLETVDFSDSMKEMQRNWIGKSQGAEITFAVVNGDSSGVSKDSVNSNTPLTSHHSSLTVYTTRPDTIFGVDFMVVAPEHELVATITTPEQQAAIDEYLHYVKSRSDRERQSEVKQITGCFTGAYAINPFNGKKIPIWIAEYVLAGYGTGAIMAVPCGDQRDFAFAQHFNIPITNIIGQHFNGEEANATKEARLQNSGFLDGLLMKDAIDVAITKIEELGIGKRQINYKMRDAGFSRQRYWGEPFPIVWKNGIAYPLPEDKLPLTLPEVKNYSPGPNGEGPLANLPDWLNQFEAEIPPSGGGGALETNTMPGYAGSSWYFLRYMDPQNDTEFCNRTVSDYWNQVDLYIGGTEHAVGHLLYSRMWTKVLYDLGYIGFDEPFKRLVNQGMIQGVSQVAYVQKHDYKENEKEEEASKGGSNTIIVNGQIASVPEPKLQLFSADVINDTNKDYFKPFNIPIELVELNTTDSLRNELDIKKGVVRYPHRLDAIYISSTGFNYNGNWFTKKGNDWVEDITNEAGHVFYTESAIEKMSKSKYNVVNPDDLCSKYGADTFRMYEMFLGPVEMSKPWDTKGIEGVHRFLKKLWRLFNDELKGKVWTEEAPTEAELKLLHKTIKNIEEVTERFSFNTGVSGFMIAVNELTDLKCHKRAILEPLLILLTPYAPHIAAELWAQLGNTGSILDASYPAYEMKYVTESSKEYPISVNGKLRTTMVISLDATQAEVEQLALGNDIVQKWLEGKPPKKIIFIKGKMVNVVV
jgi:leucyl-tRNA synthetase